MKKMVILALIVFLCLSLILSGCAQYKTVTERETIAFKTITEENPEMWEGEEKVIQEGENGEKTITFREKYENEELVEREKIGERITKQPQDRIVEIGTKILEPKGVIYFEDWLSKRKAYDFSINRVRDLTPDEEKEFKSQPIFKPVGKEDKVYSPGKSYYLINFFLGGIRLFTKEGKEIPSNEALLLAQWVDDDAIIFQKYLNILIADVTAGGLSNLSVFLENVSIFPDWTLSPDKSKISYFQTSGNFYIASLDRRKGRAEIKDSQMIESDAAVDITSPNYSWSPDSKFIAYCKAAPRVGSASATHDLYIIRVFPKLGSPKQLTEKIWDVRNIVWK
jgi:hypothetical protein